MISPLAPAQSPLGVMGVARPEAGEERVTFFDFGGTLRCLCINCIEKFLHEYVQELRHYRNRGKTAVTAGKGSFEKMRSIFAV